MYKNKQANLWSTFSEALSLCSFRLNSGPLGEYTADVGNRTTIRMSYPEGTPSQWTDTDPGTLFVAVVYKGVDISWISAMINKITVVSLSAVCTCQYCGNL